MRGAGLFVSKWPWYTKALVVVAVSDGPTQPKAKLLHDSEGMQAGTETRGILKDLPQPQNFTEMFISYNKSPRGSEGVTILVTVDEKSTVEYFDAPMGDHPLVWVRKMERGRVLNISLGWASIVDIYNQAGGYLARLLYRSLKYATGDYTGCTDSTYQEFNLEATQSDISKCITKNIEVGIRHRYRNQVSHKLFLENNSGFQYLFGTGKESDGGYLRNILGKRRVLSAD